MSDFLNAEFPGLPDWDMQPRQTEFDYSRWAPTGKMHICNVTWGTSEVAVGSRAIIGQGNVVYFGSEEERDAWFDENAQGILLDIVYRGFDQSEYRVPLPWDIACNYNYLWIEYQPATSEDELIEYETPDGTRRVFFFIRDTKIDDSAPNTTVIEVLPDYWTTFVYRVKFTGLKLKRGHWAMKNAADVGTFLRAPTAHTEYLTCPDVQPSGGYLSKIAARETYNTQRNGEPLWLLFWSCSKDTAVSGSGEIHGLEPATWLGRAGGGFQVCAMGYDEVRYFFDVLDGENGTKYTQIAAAFRGMCIVCSDYVTLGDKIIPFGLSGCTAHNVERVQAVVNGDKVTLSEDVFGYQDPYRQMTKFYTAPYALVKVTTSQGNYWEFAPETLNYLQVSTNCCFSLPSVEMRHRLLGIGTQDAAKSDAPYIGNSSSTSKVYYDANSAEHTWTSPLMLHFALVNASNYFTCTNYNARQAAYNNISATYNIQYDGADVPVTNQEVANAAIVANNSRAWTMEQGLNNDADTKLSIDGSTDKSYSLACKNASNDEMAAVTATNNQAASESTAVGAAATVANGAIGGLASVASGFMSGGIAGAIGGGISGAAQVASSAVNAATSVAQTNISNSAATACTNLAIQKADAIYNAGVAQIDAKNQAAMGYADKTISRKNSTRKSTTSNSNTAALTQVKNTRAVTRRQLAQNKTYQNAILNTQPKDYRLQQGAMSTLGTGENDAARVVESDNVTICVETLPNGEVSRIGDQFALYGYTADSWVYDANGIDFRVMDAFTYWECEKVQAVYQMPDAFADRIKILLLGGITVYNNPADVGTVSIYQ